MLTDAALRRLKPKHRDYKVYDRDSMYSVVKPSGMIVFRFDYRLNGRRETLTIGRYGRVGISLARAREICLEARRMVMDGKSPAQEKQREKRRLKEVKSFGEYGERWLSESAMANSTRAMRRAIFARDLMPLWKNRLLTEISADDLRAACNKVRNRGAPATAIHVRDIAKQIFGFAILHGAKVANPAEDVEPASIATLNPRDRALTPTEIRIVFDQLEFVPTLPAIRLGLRLILLTMVRKSELQDAVWSEINFENAVWTIPKERMKGRRPHNVYLSRQSAHIMVELKAFARNSPYVLPSPYDANLPMSRSTFNRVTSAIVACAQRKCLPLQRFSVHDLRRTSSTLLNEHGFNRDWIEKCLAHQDGRSSRGVYNKAEYEPQRRHMLQEWADMVDAWVQGRRQIPSLYPPVLQLAAPP